jgi:hypothetical protein
VFPISVIANERNRDECTVLISTSVGQATAPSIELECGDEEMISVPTSSHQVEFESRHLRNWDVCFLFEKGV